MVEDALTLTEQRLFASYLQNEHTYKLLGRLGRFLEKYIYSHSKIIVVAFQLMQSRFRGAGSTYRKKYLAETYIPTRNRPNRPNSLSP